MYEYFLIWTAMGCVLFVGLVNITAKLDRIAKALEERNRLPR